MVVNQKLKKFFFEYLDDEMLKKSFIPIGDKIWIIDETSHKWYFQINCNGNLGYNQRIFYSYMNLFNLNQRELSIVLKEWVEKTFEIHLRNVERLNSDYDYLITKVLSEKDKVLSLKNRNGFSYSLFEKLLNFQKDGKILIENFIVSP